MAVTCDMDTAPLALWWEPPVGVLRVPARRAVRPTEWVDGFWPRLGRLALTDSFLPPVGRGRPAGCVCLLPDEREASGWDVRTGVTTS
jgi:hypothetical protein